jgi:predicted nucleic acid-binding protein
VTLVVADTSVVLNLCCIGKESLLQSDFGRVLVPEKVAAEFTRLCRHSTRFSGLILPTWIGVVRAPPVDPEVLAKFQLDDGEKAALTLAHHLAADAVLIDESLGRRAAKALGLPTLGILGILLRAKAKGRISSVSDEIDALENMAGFWIHSEIKRKVLETAGE